MKIGLRRQVDSNSRLPSTAERSLQRSCVAKRVDFKSQANDEKDLRKMRVTHDSIELHWKDKRVGLISDAGVSDFPWLAGKFVVKRISKRLQTVLNWFAAQADAEELVEPPFDHDLLEHWTIVRSDGSRVELDCVPIVDLSKGTIEWRE